MEIILQIYNISNTFYLPQIPARPNVVHIVVKAGLGAHAPSVINVPSPAV